MGNLWPDIVAFDHLVASAKRAARGKRRVRGAAAFLERIEPEVLALQRELLDGSYRPQPSFSFRILDPKERVITAARFRDRVVHHALIDRLELIFDQRMIETSFACRRGKGTHAALRCASGFVRRFEYFLKLDIRKFFPSLDHEVVLDTVARIVKDRRVLELAETIVRSSAGGPGPEAPRVGLPIGNLTSQWFANLVLDRMDHHVKEVLRVPAYVRYMDDFILFAAEKEGLWRWKAAVESFLRDALRLGLKERVTCLAPTFGGLSFLGWRIFPGTMRLRPENKRRIRQRLRQRRHEFLTGRRDETSWVACVRAACAHLAHGNTLALRRSWFGCDELGARRPGSGTSEAHLPRAREPPWID